MPLLTITGANVKVYINNKVYPFIKSLSVNVEYGEEPIYGIDSPFAQEIATTKITVRGSVQGLRVSLSGGLQAMNMRPLNLITDIMANPYVSIRIQDRKTQEDILFIPTAKVVKESHVMTAKQTYQLNFDFVGMVPLFALDRS
jgi:hypothetical protein